MDKEEGEVLEAPQTPETEVEAEDTGEESTEQNQLAPQISPGVEKRARDMGWVPQAEWHGDPNRWRPADEYVRRGEEILPIVNSKVKRLETENRRYQDEIKSLRGEIGSFREHLEEDFATRIKRLEGVSRAALDAQRQQMWERFEAEKRKAVIDGDANEYDRLSKDQRDALANFRPEAEMEEEEPAPRQKKPVSPAMPQAVSDWIAENEWFNRDPELTAVASAHHGRLMKEMPGLSLDENLERTTQYVKEKFPEKFGITKPNGQQRPYAPQVEGGGRSPQSTGRDKGWNELPPEAKEAGTRFIKDDELFGYADDKDLVKAQKAFAKQYWAQEAQ